MTSTACQLEEFPSRAACADAAAGLITRTLSDQLAQRQSTSLMLSGGSTPGAVFDRLSQSRIDWHRTTVGLVDERWVDPENPASNERLVRERLLQGNAAVADFLPMWREASSIDEAAQECSRAYAPHCNPIGFVLLGMGGDGHTASWFPGAVNLARAVDAATQNTVIDVDATGCPVAGEQTARLTLTLPAIAGAESALLLINGEDKRNVFEAALAGSPDEYPVRYAIDALGARLKIYWAP